MTIPRCECGSPFRCVGCDALLRRAMADEVVSQPTKGGSLPDIQTYLRALKSGTPYEPVFPRGPRGGAVIDFGRAITLECFLPYEESGELYPFMPMPLLGDVVHDIGRTKDALRWELDACMRGMCRCDDRPTGWKLTRPILRALLGVTDSYLHEHGRQLPGVMTYWCLCVNTPEFMKEAFFNPEFVFPTRAASRAARASRQAGRRRGCKPPRPSDRRRK
jgi:hypothetical protein